MKLQFSWYFGIVVVFGNWLIVVQTDSSHVTHVSEHDDTPNSEDYEDDYDYDVPGRPIYGSPQKTNKSNSQISGITQKTDVLNETTNHSTIESSTKTIETISTTRSPFGAYNRRITTSSNVGAWKTVFPLRNNSSSSGQTPSEQTFAF